MKQTSGKLFTKIVCMILCLSMLTTSLASCGIWDALPPDDPDSDTPGVDIPGGDTPGGDTPGGDTPGGDTETTYYKVSFAVGMEEYKSRVTLPLEKLYKAGTEIQYLPTPAVRDMLFMGWYYDAATTRPVALTDKVEGDLVLYAKVVDTSGDIAVIEGVYYHTVYDVESNYIFSIKADNIEEVTSHLGIVNISSAGEPLVYGEDYTVTKSTEGIFDVVVSYKPGKTYRASVEADKGVSFVVDDIELSAQVTTLNVLVAKEEVANLKLSDGLIYIPKTQVDMLTDTPNGLVSVSDSGASVNSGSVGYFTYDGAVLKSGDKVAVYEGEIPSARDFGTDNGAVKYLIVTSSKGNNIYEYRISDSKEVLFIPDIIPVSGKTNMECEAKISIGSLDFTSDFYKQLGMDADTVIEIGDYIAFFDGPMTANTPVEYVRITDVDRDNQYYYIDYVPTTYDDVIASMDLYHTRTETPDLSETQIQRIKDQVYKKAMNSGFVEEAADYLVNLYISTNGLETMPNGTKVRYTPRMRAYANTRNSGLYYEITKCEAVPDIKIGEGVLTHFEDSNGIRIELVLSFEVEFTVGEEGQNKVVIAAEAVFEEEVLLSLNVEGGAVWEFAWIFPYIADYEMNANIDIGTYTGVSAIAKVYTNNGEEKEEEEEEDDSFFPDFDLDNIGKGDSYEEKAKNIGEELKKLFELNDNIKEEIEGEGEEDDTGNDITEKYAEMMKDANETWIEIVRVEIYKQSLNLDQFGILWFEMGIDFVVSAQLYIMAGIEVETGVAKRYNFSVSLFERSVKTDVIDLEKAHFTFKFYVMGTAGLKVGLELELAMALMSSEVASVGISAEIGVSLGIWGYFYYSYEKEAGEEPEIEKAGAMFFELGIYIEVKFKAHLFNIEKLTYNPTLYENLWPLYSVGSQENVFEFEDYDDDELVFVMQGTNSIVLPDYIFRMKYLDLKDGKYYSGTDEEDETPSKPFDDETESRFLIEISDSRFMYDPETNTLSTTVDVKNMDVDDTFEIKIQLTYKHGALAFNQEVITREITVEVKNNSEYGYIYVNLNGPATLNAVGPGGNFTYPVRHGEAFTPDMLPKYDVVKGYKFVKWIWLQNYRDVNDRLWVEGEEFVGLDSVERRTYLYLTAVWEPETVTHDVRIYKEAIGGAYVYDRTETVSGLVGSKFNLYELADIGYTVRAGERGDLYLEYNGLSDLYIERMTQSIRFLNVDGDGGIIYVNAKSGSALVPPVVSSKLGYEFVGWAEGSSGKEPCVMPEDVPYEDGIIVYTAVWTPVKDVSYTVKHYVQNANDDGFELYMTEYLSGSYNDTVRVADHSSSILSDAGFTWKVDINPGHLNDHRIELDGSTVLRVYYARNTYAIYSPDLVRWLGSYRHGQTVDLHAFEEIPSKTGYRFVGWDANGDGVKDDSIVMPTNRIDVVPVWEGVSGTEYKVIHMVKDADSDNYTQAGFTYMYGVTDTTPTVESIYSDKYIVSGQFVPNYEKGKVVSITAGKVATMYAYYDRVEYNALIKAYDPEDGSLVRTETVVFPYGRSILDKFLPDISGFDVVGYVASRYANSGYTEMPDHDIEINVVYATESSTPFIVNHYKERADGTFYLYRSITHQGRTGTALHDNYRRYYIPELNEYGGNFKLATDMIDESYVARDGSTVFNIYYVRNKVSLFATIYTLDAEGKTIGTTSIHEYLRYEQNVILAGYYDSNHVLDRVVDRETDEVFSSRYDSFRITDHRYLDIYVKPKSGVPYTVTHLTEKLDGTGYEVYQTFSYTGTHSVSVSAQNYARSIFGFTVDTDKYESIVLDADGENNLNVYYKRNVYNVSFTNSRKPSTNTSYQVKHGDILPTPPTDTAVAGYIFSEWKSYTEGEIATSDVEFGAVYALDTNTPYTVNHYVMDLDGNYNLAFTEKLAGSTNATISAIDHIHADYTVGYTPRENASVKIAPDGSTVLNIYYHRESYRFSYNYYAGGQVIDSFGVLVMHGAPIPEAFYNYIKDYPEYKLEGYSMLVNGEYLPIDSVPTIMGAENIDIRVNLEAIGPEVTIVHKVMNTDGVTYTETRTTFLAIPFKALDLSLHLLSSVNEGFSYRIPVNNQIPDALAENVYEIYYDRNTYVVRYKSSYSFETIIDSYLYGASIGASPTFDRPGYIHNGWDAQIPETMPATDISFTTTWQIRESVPVTIIHMMTTLDGEGYVEKRRETVYYTPELTIYGESYATGITGGTYKSAENKEVALDGSTEVCVYYTRNEYTIRFTYGDIQGAGEDIVYKLPYESAITAPDFKVAGYVLVGWTPDVPETVPAENITYTARWEAAAANVTVNHMVESLDGSNLVSETEIVSVATGSSINGAAYKKELTGFTFKDADKNIVVQPGNSTVINVYYTRNSYKLNFTYGDKQGEAVEHTVKYGAALPTAPVFSVVGYTFTGWNTKLLETMPASDLTYEAQWTAGNVQFTVEHHYQNANDDNYTKVESETKHGTTASVVNGADYQKALANAIFERAESKVIAADGSTVIKVYYKRTTHTITFTYGDKAGESVRYTLRYGQTVSYNPSFSVVGYVFAGWDKQIPATMPAENVTINATWTAGDGIQYKVEHYLQNANDDDYKLDHTDNRTGVTGTVIDGATLATLIGGGIILKSAESKAIAADGSTVIKIYYDRANYTVTYTYGDKIGEAVVATARYGAKLPEAPVFTVVGYTFRGWDSELASTMPATNLTYDATWTANTDTKFTVEHHYQNANDDGYTVVNSEVMQGTTGATVNGADYKKELDEAIYEKADVATILADGSTVIKVYYKRTTYTLTFSYDYVSQDEEVYTLRYGATLPAAPLFSAPGYIFNGWYDEEGCYVEEFAATMPASNLIYKAIWMERDDTKFTVEHYIEQAGGHGYDLVDTAYGEGRTGSTIDDYWQFVLYDDGVMYVFERFNSEELVINPDGSTVLKIYYQRVRYVVNFIVVDEIGNEVNGMDYITTEVKYGQTITPPDVEVLEGYIFVGFNSEHDVMPEHEIEYYIVWRCMHESNDGDDMCDRCNEPLECTDADDNGHCDYCRVPMDPDDHRYVDNNEDHVCDICSASFVDLCFDNDKNGICDLCGQHTVCPVTGEDHKDEDEMKNHLCDDCGVWMSYMCVMGDGKHECAVCYARFYDMCTDEDGDCWCDECIEPIPCKDEDNDGFCDVCESLIPCDKHVDEDQNALCDRCVENLHWCDEYDDMHRDDNTDHLCDYCGLWLSYNCSDWTDDGRCEDCYRPAYCMQELGKYHRDEDGDHYCDECGCWMSYVCTDADGDHYCDECGNELKCFDHVDENQDAACDICGAETKCKANPLATYHEDSAWDHVCDWCGVWVSIWCIDEDHNGYCDESGCGREFVCKHVDEDEDNYCDRCQRIINCTHESVSMHICDTCNQKVTDCYSEDGDLFCDECWEEIECNHEGTMDAHVCTWCYAYLSNCDDKDGDGECDLSENFPHSVQ